MIRKTELREAAYDWVKGLPHGRVFGHSDTYRFLEEHFAMECSQRGDAATEPRYRNDARWAVQDALGKTSGKTKVIEQTGRGQFRRL